MRYSEQQIKKIIKEEIQRAIMQEGFFGDMGRRLTGRNPETQINGKTPQEKFANLSAFLKDRAEKWKKVQPEYQKKGYTFSYRTENKEGTHDFVFLLQSSSGDHYDMTVIYDPKSGEVSYASDEQKEAKYVRSMEELMRVLTKWQAHVFDRLGMTSYF